MEFMYTSLAAKSVSCSFHPTFREISFCSTAPVPLTTTSICIVFALPPSVFVSKYSFMPRFDAFVSWVALTIVRQSCVRSLARPIEGLIEGKIWAIQSLKKKRNSWWNFGWNEVHCRGNRGWSTHFLRKILEALSPENHFINLLQVAYDSSLSC